MNKTCDLTHNGDRCGKPAVEHVDIPIDPPNKYHRIYLCADHAFVRDEITGGGSEFL